MIRLRRGKWRACGASPSGISETITPWFLIARIEFLILRRIDDVHAAGHHRDGADRQRRLMGGRIDAARQARDDHQPGIAQFARQNAGEFARQRRGVARADDGDHFAAAADADGPAR